MISIQQMRERAAVIRRTLRAAAGEAEGETRVLLNECVKKCEESHT